MVFNPGRDAGTQPCRGRPRAMRKNLKTDETEPKNANHGQNEQNRVEGKNGKGSDRPTHRGEHGGKSDGSKASK